MIRWCITAVMALSLGCAQTHTTTRKAKTNDGALQAGLIAGLQGLHAPKPGEAKVTFAIFGGDEFSNADRLNQVIQPILDADLGSLKARRARNRRPYIVSASVDAELPIELDTLVLTTGHRTAFEAATHVAFVRYAGPRLESDQHLLTALKIVGLLAKRPGHLVVDMSTRKVLSSSEWSAWSKSQGFSANRSSRALKRVQMG